MIASRTPNAAPQGPWNTTRRVLAAAALLCAGPMASVRAASAPQQDFVALEHRWVSALQNHDTAFLDALLDDSFVDSTFRGAIRRKHDVLAGPRAAPAYRSIRLDDLVVRRYGADTAIVTGVNVLRGTAGGDTVRVRFTDVFVRRHGSWRAVSAQETLQSPQRR